MQRKRTGKDVYASSVELGSAVLPVAKMRKFAMKKLLKICVVVIIIFIIYSVYRKNDMAANPPEDARSAFEDLPIQDKKVNDLNVADARQDNNDNKDHVDIRVKEQINKVFEEFKKKQEDKYKEDNVIKDIMENRRDDFDDKNNDDNNNDYNNNDDNNDDAQQDENGDYDDDQFEDMKVELEDDADDIADEFDDVDEDVEKAERELEREIEERLAGAFGDAVKEAAEADEEKVAVAAEKMAVEQAAVPEEKKQEVPRNIEIQKIIEHMEFNAAVDKMGKRLHPLEVQRMHLDARKHALRHDDDHEFPPFVTAVRQSTIDQVKQLISSVHHHMPGRKVYVYSLDLTNDQKRDIMAICGVRLKHFMGAIFPSYVMDLDNMHWKPLVMQTALAEFGHMTWINPGFILASSELAPIVHESHERGIIVIGQTASYTTFSATHPDMLKFISTDKTKLSKEPHVEIRAIMMHNTQEVHDNIMKVFAACALETSCLAPPGAKWTCKFDFTGRKHADCHRYDESALNILLKNFYDFQTTLFTRRNNYFRNYDKDYRPKLKQCRKINDIKDSEL